jgi:MFS family permease
MVLLALFGAVMGQGVIWYTGQFYAQSFLENTVKIEFMQNREILLWGIALATPFFVFFGWLSDKIGRKWIMLTGMLLGVIFYRPIFGTMLKDADMKQWTTTEFVFISEDVKVSMHNGDSVLQISTQYQTPDNSKFTRVVTDTLTKDKADLQHIIKANKNAVFKDKILNKATYLKFIFLIWIMIIFVTMVYGPVAAFLVELFPTKIRYTSMSLPYHIGNGVFGGLVPFIATLLSATFVSDPLVGLWYPIGVAALCFIIGALYLSNSIDKNIND